MRDEKKISISRLLHFRGGLIPVVVQGSDGRVLMLAHMNRRALELSLSTGLMHYWSRSRRRLWMKGEISGHRQRIIEARVNCEMNSMLFTVHQIGGCCHEGYATCYYRALRGKSLRITEKRVFDPEKAYGPMGRGGVKIGGKFTGR